VISGYYGYANPGDEAILGVLLSELRALWPEAHLQVISGTPEETAATYQVESLLWSDPAAIGAAVQSADLVVSGGGGIFHDYGGFPPDGLFTEGNWGLGFHVTAGALAALFGKPHLIYAVGVGPLLTEHGRSYTRAICETASVISVRDEGSRELLVEIGVPAQRVVVTADPAFLFEPATAERAQEILAAEGVAAAGTSRPLIGIAIRHWAHGVEQEEWEAALAEGLRIFLETTPAQLVFLPFQRFPGEQEDDLAVVRRVSELLPQSVSTAAVHLLTGIYTPAEKAALLGSCQTVVGMRLHALIFSMTAGVPFVALTYDDKVRQVVRRAGRAEFGIDMAELQPALLAERLQASIALGPMDVTPLQAAAQQNIHLLSSFGGQQQQQRAELSGGSLELLRLGVTALLAAQKQLRHWVRDQQINYEFQIGVQQRELEAAKSDLDQSRKDCGEQLEALDTLRQQESAQREQNLALGQQLDELKAQWQQETARAETAEAAGRELDAALKEVTAQLAAQRELHRQTVAEWEAYAAEVHSRLSVYRTQRAWRGMLALRKAYVLLTRQGWSGRLRFLPWLLSLASGGGNLETEQLEFPARPRPADPSGPATR
jgi:polysaccharide pyruvyl transferase CsaB